MTPEARDLQEIMGYCCIADLSDDQAEYLSGLMESARRHRTVIDECLSIRLEAVKERAERRI